MRCLGCSDQEIPRYVYPAPVHSPRGKAAGSRPNAAPVRLYGLARELIWYHGWRIRSRALTGVQTGDDEWALTKHVQLALQEKWSGYAPPSTCTIVSLPSDMAGDGHNPWSARHLAVVPTMRTPEDVSWHQDLVYNSMWSLLVAVSRWNEIHPEEKIERVLMTGLATGQGGFTAEKCAEQMMLAVKHFTEGLPGHFKWDTVIPRDEQIRKTYS
ncbi:hypothetical protein NLJ89_g7598 [Agrocybe chaxingu]|uniref:Macro domain-like protein n=1 Tax=Agrocybe chaxingu TaxID=84603 RepID=A0A9W8MUW8_9AGAR|nr:hypothetical protein NLJ89_g7598 [Agrocybe chaxingu]